MSEELKLKKPELTVAHVRGGLRAILAIYEQTEVPAVAEALNETIEFITTKAALEDELVTAFDLARSEIKYLLSEYEIHPGLDVVATIDAVLAKAKAP